MNKRRKIRLISFLSAAFLCLGVWGCASSLKAHKYETEARLSDQRALTSLNEYTDSIETALIKSIYAETDSMLSKLTSQLLRDSSGAKESLSALSSGENKLYNTYKFLSQVGEYTAALNKKAARGEKITAKERETLKKLRGFASELSARFNYMSKLMSDGSLSFSELDRAAAETEKGSENMVSFMESVSDAEEAFKDFPTLLYDGPFSDNILQKESALLKNSSPVSAGEAKKRAAKLCGLEEKYLVEDKSSAGRAGCYNFRSDSIFISVTKNGGFPLVMLSAPAVGEEKLTSAEAVNKAAIFLNSAGFKDMAASYYASTDGICTINFAYKQNSFICYPDLIKVSVALDSGKISGFDASDFIMNHIDRNIPDARITPEQAAEAAAQGLTVKKISEAVIPTPSGGEKYTYELLCSADSGQQVLIYKNIEDGSEEDILLLLYADNGTLTK